MKKLIALALMYSLISVMCAFFYKRFVEYHSFDGNTTLKYLHSFILLMGVVLILLLAIFEANYRISSDKSFIYFIVMYNISMFTSIVGMFVRGVMQVLGFEMLRYSNVALIFALVLGYVGMVTGLIMLTNILRRTVKEDSVLIVRRVR